MSVPPSILAVEGHGKPRCPNIGVPVRFARIASLMSVGQIVPSYYMQPIMSQAQTVEEWAMWSQLRDGLIALTMAYLNRHPGRIADPAQLSADQARIVALRDSVLYRFESLEFHLGLLHKRYSACLQEFRSDPFRRDGIEVVRWSSRDLKFLFDDMVFTTISLFDYAGTMVGFVMHDERTRNIKWAGARRCASQATDNDPKSVIQPTNRIFQSSVGDLVTQLNREWIKGLSEYRNALIHERSDRAGGTLRHEIGAGTFSISVEITAPIEFTKRISSLSHHTSEQPLDLLEAASWLVTQTFAASVALVGSLTADASCGP